jgi:SMI1/KNR4 family protein SUKH-1
MVANGLELPALFEEFVRGPDLPARWVLREETDAYGNHFESELRLLRDVETMEQGTEALPVLFEAQVTAPLEEIEEMNAWAASEPGFIPYLCDFSKVVWFGDGHEDSPFCFDFRDSLQEPSVIYWNDAWWRRVAPSFERFVALYKPADDINLTAGDPIEPVDLDSLFDRRQRPPFLW